jgi:hypothetical protein
MKSSSEVQGARRHNKARSTLASLAIMGVKFRGALDWLALFAQRVTLMSPRDSCHENNTNREGIHVERLLSENERFCCGYGIYTG